MTATVSGSGNVASADTISASFATGGTVTAIKVKTGQKVTANQVLATIDASCARRSLASAQAQLDSAQAQYNETARIRQRLQAAGISLPTPSARPSFSPRPSPTPGVPRPSRSPGQGGFGAGRGLFNDPKVQAALKACGVTLPSPGSFRPGATPTPSA